MREAISMQSTAEREMIGFPPDEGGHQHALRGNPPEMAEGEVVLGFTHDEGGNQDAWLASHMNGRSHSTR